MRGLQWIKTLFIICFICFFLAVMLGYFYFKRLPVTTGQITVAGLRANVVIEREPTGIIHIRANNLADLFFAQGYAQAQERLWQMEFQRLIGQGRLAEVLGSKALKQDKFLRTWGFYRHAQEAYQHLSREGKQAIDSFVNGINAYIATHPPLPPEFTLLGHSPQMWTGADALAWVKLMAFRLAGNRQSELTYYRLLARGLSPARLRELMPLYPENTPIILSESPVPSVADITQNFDFHDGFSAASNNWVLHGSRTVTGFPLLANDPHLTLQAPSTWLLMHLQSPEINVIGASLVGVPLIAIGRNQHIAWGVTNLEGDVEDLYLLQPSTLANHYIYRGENKAYVTHTETIHVKGGEAVTLAVQESVYGVVINSALGLDEKQPIALRWTGFEPDDTTLDAYLQLNQAHNWDDFLNAMRAYVVPSQNFVYADIAGNIGYFVPGRLPIRRQGHTGLQPVAGTGEWDWQGFIPFDQLPKTFNPAKGYIATANNRAVPDTYPYPISFEWLRDPYRARRIEELLAQKPLHNLQDMQKIQRDNLSLLFAEFRPYLAQLTPTTIEGEKWLPLLLAWNGEMAIDSQAAFLFQAWYIELSELPAAETGEKYWYLYPRYLLNALKQGDSACHARKQTCIQFATEIWDRIVNRYAPTIPTWGEKHQAMFEHPVLTHTFLSRLSDRQRPHGSDRYTVNVGWFDPQTFEMSHGVTYRQIIDLADMEQSLFIHPMGQSGHLLSPHYDDFLDLWDRGEYLPMKTRDYAVAEKLELLR